MPIWTAFWHLVCQSLVFMPAIISGNWVSIFFPLAIFLCGEGFRIKKEGWRTVKWLEVRRDLFLMLGAYGALFLWAVAHTVYEDHAHLVSWNRKLADNAKTLSERNESLIDPHSKDGEIQNLKDQLNIYRNAQSPTVKVFPIAHAAGEGTPKIEYVLTSGSIRTPVDLIADCDIPIAIVWLMPMTTTGGSSATLNQQRISATRYSLLMQLPAWSQASPLWVTISFTPPVNAMPHCSFTAE
jgi:hypothetical protein